LPAFSHSAGVVMSVTKEKSWSVKLVEGSVLSDQVRAEKCKGCDRIPQLIVGNDDESNLVLYGCVSQKCRHSLIRVDLNREHGNGALW
jgi:hypothetical protein